MKKRLIVIAVLFICLGFIAAVDSQAMAKAKEMASFNGYYDVTFTLEQGQKYSSRIYLEDCKDGTVEASADYKGYPVTVSGELSGKVEEGGAVCHFDLNRPGLVTGQAELSIVMVEGINQLSGRGSINYNYQGKNGQISATMLGSRSNWVPPAPTYNIDYKAVLFISAVLLVGAGILLRIYSKRKAKV